MSFFLDTILGRAPAPYDPEDDKMAKVDPIENRSLPFLARRTVERHAAVRRELSDVAIEVYGTRRLLIVIIGLLIASKAIDISIITGLLTP